MPENEAVVEFKVKDLFMDIKRDLHDIKDTLTKKADKTDLDKLEEEVVALKQNQASKAAIDQVSSVAQDTRRQWIAILASIIIGLGGLVVEFLRH